MRWRAAGIILLMIVTSCGGDVEGEARGTQTAGPTDPVVLNGMLLHLPDAPTGATIGDDSHCGAGLSPDGDSNPFLDLAIEARGAVVACFAQLEAPDVLIDTLVLSFPNPDLAKRAVTPEAFEGIVAYFALDDPNGPPLDPPVAGTVANRGAVTAGSMGDTSAVIAWRFESVVGAVSVKRHDGRTGALADANQLAALQDSRMRSPVIVPADIDDDRLVGLEAAEFPALWLGDVFTVAGYPPAPLYSTRYSAPLLELDYSGIRIELFNLDALAVDSQQSELLGVAGELFDSPCTVSAEVQTAQGEAEIVGRFVPPEFLGPPVPGRTGWGSLVTDACPAGEPNIWMATLRYGEGMLLRINAPICYGCLVAPSPERPFREPPGLEALLRALEPFRS